jgi:amidase
MRRLTLIGLIIASTVATMMAVTRLPSADGQYWDIQDTSTWAQDSGGIATGGRANPFNGFGYLKLEHNQYLRGFGLAHDGERFDSITPILREGIVIDRAIFAPKDTDYLRYIDSFTNATASARVVRVAWGGAAGAFEDGGRVTIATTSNGDRKIDLTDSFVTVMQNARGVENPMAGPSGHGPSAHVLGSKTTGVLTRIGDMYADPFVDAWPGYDPAQIGYVFTLSIKPGETVSLMTFVVKGLSEVYDPRGGFPIPLRDALVVPKSEAVFSEGAPKIPAAGSEIARVSDIARKLVSDPDLRGLSPRQRAQIVNWRLPDATRNASASGSSRPNALTSASRSSNASPPSNASRFSVFEKTVPQLQDALTRGEVTSEDVVREYLRRQAMFDRNGPTFRAMLRLNTRIVADARLRDAERAAGNVRGAFHGIPIAFKDNIDVHGLPTTGGSLALVEHLPRLDSRMAASMIRAGAIVMGKTNLDEFPFGDFGISSVGGTIGNAYDPSLSTAGSSGGSAVSVSTSLVSLAFGTDTCNSLSNPSAFASLATIRTTRGLTSRAGVMPLNTFNDAVGPMAKSVRELAMVLDAVAGTDPEDDATKEADQHIGNDKNPSFTTALDAAALKGARIGVMRQLFVGITGEREAATLMERVITELRTAGASVVDVAIPDLDAQYRAASGSAPGSLKAGWNAYLSRGFSQADKGKEKPLTIDDLLASGKLAPDSARRFERAIAPIPSGDELRAATEKFYAGRERFRQLFVDLMEREQLDVLLYPANQARPHTHEGGLERYGGEPGTCEESAMTGLPQVTVPAGYLGNRYPFGVSFLGRLWADRRVLGIAFAYEQATHHRHPPAPASAPATAPGRPASAAPAPARAGNKTRSRE